MPAAVDWSWGQAIHSPTPFPSESMLPQNPENKTWSVQDPSSSTGALREPDIFRYGFKVNAFRTAVPSPTTESTMPQLELQNQRRQPVAGRKRSRAELFDDDSSDPYSASTSDGASGSPSKAFRTDDEAMTDTRQNGVRAEELAERLQSTFSNSATRPMMREARKSIRLDSDATAFERAQLHAPGNVVLEARVQPQSQAALSHQRGPSGHDEAALTLGVGWSSIPATPIMLAAARGWARFIETSFPLRNVKVVWKNEGINAFLVSAATLEVSVTTGQLLPGSPGYYLFDENMSQGKLVAKSWERSIDHLRAQPMQFDGEGVMEAGSQPNGTTWVDATDRGSERGMGMELD